ncbi:hypothetical protein MYRNA_69 [Mycobacterium phage Myrna]|uniref:Uncharacterized protein n=1 Tax=Mycobacterium phage Myrna TaxID=546805 RepID=B5LJ80_9CAUD|nr:gp69 [Mycobacterium phage Myrna]ACH62077.1 hypothetical protein MYRNA_69 [Mycobacterium phage Myrna]
MPARPVVAPSVVASARPFVANCAADIHHPPTTGRHHMKMHKVAVYGNRVAGPFDDRTADMFLVDQFEIPNVGSTIAALEYVVGQINNRSSAKFVAPAFEQLGRNIRAGDVINLDHQDYVVVATLQGQPRFEEYKG